MKKLALIGGLLLMLSPLLLAQKDPVHPRGLVLGAELPGIRAKLQTEPVKTMYRVFLADLKRRIRDYESGAELTRYDLAHLTVDQAGMYLLSEDPDWAQKAYAQTLQLIRDTTFVDPFSWGLSRAMLLQQVAIAYDWCYPAWSATQRQVVNDALFDGMFSVNANMGFAANYAIESNWMGVRFGAVILAASVWDDPRLAEGQRSRALPLLWDASKRLKEHLALNLYSNGWNGESLGYHNYDWSFVGPALIALRNGSDNNPAFLLENFAPQALSALQAQMIATVAIPGLEGQMTKIDLSDDNLNASLGKLLSLGWRLYPEAEHGAYRWMYHYLHPKGQYGNFRSELLYAILFHPEERKAVVPPSLQYHDPEQGIIVLRNRYQDENDIVAAYSATARRIHGHQGPDTNTPRLLGLGVPWIIGGGRTGEIAGQSNLFPPKDKTAKRGDRSLGHLLHYHFGETGGYAIGEGSCLGVENHRRFFLADFSPETGAEAVVILADSSTNGGRLRLCTPEFNQSEVLADGYRLTAPNGATMRVRVIGQEGPVPVAEELVRYGGATERLNPGILHRGEAYPFSRAMDILCEGNITVVITLQRAGQSHPDLQFFPESRMIHVGEAAFQIR